MKSLRVSSNVKQIPMQNVTPQNVQQQNNNTKHINVINALKQKQMQQQQQQKLKQVKQQNVPVQSQKIPVQQLQKQQSQTLQAQTQITHIPQKKQSQLILGAKKLDDVRQVERQKIVTLASGITITPINKNSTAIDSVTIKPRTDTARMSPKPLSSAIQVQLMKTANISMSRPAKRVAPTKISDTVTMRASSIEKSSDSDMLSRDSSSVANDEMNTHNVANGKRSNDGEADNEPNSKRQKLVEHVELTEDYGQLIGACKNADPTEDMNKIVAKLEKYYHRAHPDYLKSRSFQKLVRNVTNEIISQPSLVYLKINCLLDELKTRRFHGQTEELPTEVSEVDEKKTKKIQKLSEALRILQKRIRKCEEAEVDWEDELNSNYLLTERFKKRACDIYEKLCDLTGESRSAERIVKKPIKFTGTTYPEFNRKLEKFINESKSFPDMFDVLRIMDHCIDHYGYRLSREKRKSVGKFGENHIDRYFSRDSSAELFFFN